MGVTGLHWIKRTFASISSSLLPSAMPTQYPTRCFTENNCPTGRFNSAIYMDDTPSGHSSLTGTKYKGQKSPQLTSANSYLFTFSTFPQTNDRALLKTQVILTCCYQEIKMTRFFVKSPNPYCISACNLLKNFHFISSKPPTFTNQVPKTKT